MASFIGTPYGDYLNGTEYPDLIKGRGGDDQILGYGGDDVLYGDAGWDTLSGGDGNDKVHGGADDDYIFEGYWSSWSDGADTYWGDRGNDQIYLGVDYRQDTVYGGEGDDYIRGGTGFDRLTGGPGNDYISMMGGIANGDTVGGNPAFGDDVIVTDLQVDYGTARIITTGAGADYVGVRTSSWDYVTTQVTVTDFSARDSLQIENGYTSLLPALDANDNGWLDQWDGWSEAGSISLNADSRSLNVNLADGDVLTFLNAPAIDVSDFVFGV